MRGAIGLVLTASLALLAVPARGAGEAGAAPPREAWVGRWTLDDERSDPPDRMLEAMEVPWHLKLVAAAFDPAFELTVAGDGDGVEIESEIPLGSPRVQQLHGDGVEYDGEDVLERSFRETSRWTPEGQLVVTRRTKLPSGKTAVVVSTWSLAGEALRNEMKVTVGDAPSFPVKRVFVRDDADG